MYLINDELTLVRMDDRNLAIIKGHEPKDEKKGYGNRVVGYYGSIQGAFQSVLNHQIKSGATGVEAKEILQAIDELNEKINSLDLPTMISLVKNKD